jgi:hypothetical protein
MASRGRWEFDDRAYALWWVAALHDDPDAMRLLAASLNLWIRRGVARAPRLPQDVAALLARDEDPRARRSSPRRVDLVARQPVRPRPAPRSPRLRAHGPAALRERSTAQALASVSFTANPRNSAPATEVAVADSRLRRRNAAARRVPLNISALR